MDTIQTNPSEGVSNQFSGTDKSTEQILNDLHKVKREWILDLEDFISFVSDNNKKGEEYEWGVFDYTSNQTNVVMEEGYVLDLLDEYDLWDKVERLVLEKIYKELEQEQRIVLDYLDGEEV